jgi:hypothetical protein
MDSDDEHIFLIDDIRDAKMLRGVTFSEFKKIDAKRELLKYIHDSKIEPACYWSAEFICAGHYHDLWDIIIEFYFKYIHLGNPKATVYLDARLDNFANLVSSGYINYELGLRNVKKVRELFGEIICVLCESKRHNTYAGASISPIEFDLTKIGEKLTAPSPDYAKHAFQTDDPKQLYIAVNELAYNITEDAANCMRGCYWVDWVLAANSRCKKNGTKLTCERRNFSSKVKPTYQLDIVWIIWTVLLNESETRSDLVRVIAYKTLNLFCLNYTPGSIARRKLMIYFVISILTETISMNEPIVHNKDKTSFIINNIDVIYKQIGRNGQSTNMEYMMGDTQRNANLGQTVNQIAALNQFENSFIPRSDAAI